MHREISAFAPGTVANMACGFDILGFALASPGDEVTVRRREQRGLVIRSISGDGGQLSLDPQQNTAGVAIAAYLDYCHLKDGVEIEIRKHLPVGSGLGSSAASAVAGVVAVNALFGNRLEREALLPFALAGEQIASGGAIHADNVGPALFGGIILARSNEPPDIVPLPLPERLHYAVITPAIQIRTADAREVMPRDIPLKTAAIQWGNVGGLVAGLMRSDYALIGRSLQDAVAEPVRARLIPYFRQVKQAALQAGALGCSISGSGPSIFALSDGSDAAGGIAIAMQQVLQDHKVESAVYVSKISDQGARIIHE